MRSKTVQLLTLVLFSLYLGGCSAIYTSMAKSDLHSQTKMSRTIFLDPMSADKRIIFVQIRNTSDRPAFELENQIKQKLRHRGYQVTDDPEQANYWLQANVRRVTEDDGQYGENALNKGFQGALTGGYIGSAFGSGDGKVGAVIAGALIGMAVEASTSDVYYTAVTDVLVSVRAREGEVLKTQENTRIRMGANGHRRVTSSGTTDMKQYQTRIVSTANKVNLEYEEAAFTLRNGLINSISGIF
ncbi:MAG: complement resistance protein TraT [Psychrosphaera sp.]|nr:complement resistance protein TraT [Psychrosphaera sp.]